MASKHVLTASVGWAQLQTTYAGLAPGSLFLAPGVSATGFFVGEPAHTFVTKTEDGSYATSMHGAVADLTVFINFLVPSEGRMYVLTGGFDFLQCLLSYRYSSGLGSKLFQISYREDDATALTLTPVGDVSAAVQSEATGAGFHRLDREDVILEYCRLRRLDQAR